MSLELENVDSNIGKRMQCQTTRTRFAPRPHRIVNRAIDPSAGKGLESLTWKYIDNPTSHAAREYLQV